LVLVVLVKHLVMLKVLWDQIVYSVASHQLEVAAAVDLLPQYLLLRRRV
tara:strand:- start:470 stop:616 length:147 start_codon:yes stop_codon:yes gene_type:complete